MLETMQENDLFDMFPAVFSNVVHILGVILATFCSAERSFTELVKVTSAAPWGNNVLVNIALINIERAYANSVVNSDMDRIIDIFDLQNGKDSYFF